MSDNLSIAERRQAINNRKRLIQSNFETIDTNAGKISFNKDFFCGCIGLGVSTTIGGVVLGFASNSLVMPAITTGLGLVATFVNVGFLGKENRLMDENENQYYENVKALNEVETIEANNIKIKRK